MNANDSKVIDSEVQKLVDRHIVTEIKEGWKFVSNIFVRPKPNNKFRLIIDLSPLNKFILKEHFKMDNLQSAVELMRPGVYISSIDLRDAYYTLPIAEEFKPYICFQWSGKIFMFHVMPFGLTSAPRFFTKIMKPAMSALRKKGISVFNYIDDLFIVGDSKSTCEHSVKEVIDMVTKLGFFINFEKSSLTPQTTMRFLGFMLDTVEMIIFPPVEKVEKTLLLINKFLAPGNFKIREVASLVGVLNDLSHGVDYSKAHMKGLEIEKNIAVKQAGENSFEGIMSIGGNGLDDLCWWAYNLEGSCKIVNRGAPSITIETDASSLGWGAISQGKVVNGKWELHETKLHINALETLAVYKAITTLFPNVYNTHFRLLCDNTTAIAYINKSGGTWSYHCNKFSKLIWGWCQQYNNWISATFIPGKYNAQADFASRHFTADTEWGLNPELFKMVCRTWFIPEVDLFASFNNHLISKYVSWGPDPKSIACDAFLLNWGLFKSVFIFPPFRLVLRCIKKIKLEKPSGILVVPNWPGQVWFAEALNIAKRQPILIPRKAGNLVPKCLQNTASTLHSTPIVFVRF